MRELGERTATCSRAVGGSDGALEFTLSERWQQEVRERGMMQVLEVLRRRIDDPIEGIPDSVVTRQGEDRILVQIPGGGVDRTRAREMLKVTGFLEFKIVRDSTPDRGAAARQASGRAAARDRDRLRAGQGDRSASSRPIWSRSKADLTGDYLEDARVGFDNRQRPIVQFQFNPEGGELFRKLTGEHIGEQLAIVLDDRVYSAPVIRSRIGSRGQIEGRFSSAEAADLAVVLRSGSLSLPVTIEEERTVGPGAGGGFDRRGDARHRRELRDGARLHALLLPLLGGLRGHRPGAEPRDADRPDDAVRGDAHAAGPAAPSCSRSAWPSTPTC